MTYKLIPLLLFLSGCSGKNLVIKNFETTNSPCLDALIVNITASGCNRIETEQQGEYLRVKCLQRPKTPVAFWTEGDFYITHGEPSTVPAGAQPVCADAGTLVLYISPQ